MNTTESGFERLFADARTGTEYWKEKAVLDFTEEVVARMQQLGISRSQLAEKIGAKPAFVTKILRGDNNFTLDTMVRIARALSTSVRLHLEPDGTESEWLNFAKEEPSWAVAIPVVKADLRPQDFRRIFKRTVQNEQLVAA